MSSNGVLLDGFTTVSYSYQILWSTLCISSFDVLVNVLILMQVCVLDDSDDESDKCCIPRTLDILYQW